MSQINIEELKTLIANGIREQNLHESLPEDAVEKITRKILALRDKESALEMPDIVSEVETADLNYSSGHSDQFPDQRELEVSPEQHVSVTGETSTFDNPSGAVPTEQPSDPTMGYTPELPEMLQKAAPGELFVFRYNDVGESGENLSNKPMRLMDDPDVKKSMHDLWIQEGKTKAKVFVAKFEEMGEIDFNYADGTSKFTEKSALPDHAGGPEYQENPYAAASLPQVDAATQENLETYMKSSVDLEKTIHDIVMKIIKDSLLTNTEQAVNNNTLNIQENDMPMVAVCPKPTSGEMPMMLTKDEFEKFQLTMEDVVKDDNFERVDLPKELNEAITSGDKTMLVQENEHMQKWSFKNVEYYTPLNRLSKSKGYTKY